MKTKTSTASILAILLGASSAFATPSGLSTLPTDVVIPKKQGRTIPVELIPHLTDKKTVYVKPLEGEFVSQGVVKSPIANCNLVKQELKIADINVKARVELALMLRQAQRDHQRSQKEHKKVIRNFERLTALAEPFRKRLETAKADKREILAELKEIKAEISEIRDLMTIEEDEQKLDELRRQITQLEQESKAKKVAMIKAGKAIRKAGSDLSALEIELAEAEGKKKGFEKTLLIQTEGLGRIQAQLDNLQAQSDNVLKKYSGRIGGYTTFTSEFAPASFIAALKEANPNYQFQYVPSVTASVEATIPGNITPGAPLEARIGTLILDAKWSNPESTRLKKAFRRHLREPKLDVKDPVKLAQTNISEFESSLSGTKFLSLQLSTLGFCALKEPHTLSSQFVGGAADTFKLALAYTYPMNYAIRIKGRYNAYSSLYELHKMTKKSSWFGLSKTQRREHVRRISNSRNISVKVEPIGMTLSPQESLALTEKVKDQLVFYAVEPFLDKKGAAAVKLDDPGELGASTVGKRLMLIPNPYAFWGGLVLTSLGEMFGSSTSESIQRISQSSWVNIDYDSGFSFLVPGDITIGDLKRTPVKEG